MNGALDIKASAKPVSVVMPFHRFDEYLIEAIESIRASLGVVLDFVLVGDVPVFGELQKLAKKYEFDTRLRVVRNAGVGVVAARNTGINLARHEFVAVMDSDDIASNERLLRQAEFLEHNPNCSAIGSAICYICPHGNPIGVKKYPKYAAHMADTKFPLLPLMAAPAVMYRKSEVIKVGQYREGFDFAEDHDLWNRLQNMGDCRNLLEPLLSYRIHPNQVSSLHHRIQTSRTFKSNIIRVLKTMPFELEQVTSTPISKSDMDHILSYLENLRSSQLKEVRRIVGFFLVRNWRAISDRKVLLAMVASFPFSALAFGAVVISNWISSKRRDYKFDRCAICKQVN